MTDEREMPDLFRCFEAAGFTDVKTVLSIGNVGKNVTTRTWVTIQTIAR
jgi:hypothetical protein